MIQHSRYLTSLADAAADTQSKHAHCLAVRASWRTLIRCCTVWLWGLDMLSPVHVISGISQRLLTVLGLWVLLYADRIHTHRCCLLWLDCTHPEILYLFHISAEGVYLYCASRVWKQMTKVESRPLLSQWLSFYCLVNTIIHCFLFQKYKCSIFEHLWFAVISNIADRWNYSMYRTVYFVFGASVTGILLCSHLIVWLHDLFYVERDIKFFWLIVAVQAMKVLSRAVKLSETLYTEAQKLTSPASVSNMYCPVDQSRLRINKICDGYVEWNLWGNCSETILGCW